jgi:hypothetical protein
VNFISVILFSLFFSSALGQQNIAILKTKFNECISKRSFDSLSSTVISGVILPDNSVGLAIEVKCHDRSPEQGLRCWIEADTIAIISPTDTLWATSFIRDTIGFYQDKEFIVNYVFIIQLKKEDKAFLAAKEVTAIDLSYIYLPGYISIPIDEKCRGSFKVIVK